MDHDGKKGEMIFMDKVEIDKYSPLHKTGHISKGDQRKWKIENLWYKADYMGYAVHCEWIPMHGIPGQESCTRSLDMRKQGL